MGADQAPSRAGRGRIFNSIVVLVALYAVVTGLLVIGSRFTLRESAWEVMEATARLVSNEIATALEETVVEQLARPEGPDRAHLLESVTRMAAESATVQDASIVGPDGSLVATTEPLGDDQHLPSPELLFGRDARTRVAALQGPDLSEGRFLVEIPFLADGRPVAYLRLDLRSKAIAGLYRGGYLVLTVVAAFGLLTIGGLALLLHLQYRQRQQQAIHHLTAALEGRSVEDLQSDRALRPILDAADRIRDALSGAREQTREVREQLLRLGRSLDVGVVLLSRDGGVEGVGARALELLRVEEGPQMEERVAEVLAPLRERMARQGARQQFEVDLVTNGAPDRVLRAVVAPFESATGGAVVRLRDRADLEAIQRDLMEAAKLRSLGGLYLGMAHDLKSPVNAIVLNLENLAATLADAPLDSETSRRTERMLGALSDELQRLRRSLEMLLSYAAPTATVGATRFDAGAMLREIADLLSPQARQQKVDLEVAGTETRTCVDANRDQIKQAILNLAVNALEAMPEGGTLTLALEPTDGRVCVVVTDTGDGIAEEVQPRLFQLRVTTKQTGTGIGLHVARTGVETWGGSVTLRRTGSDGTSFAVELPACEEGSRFEDA